VSVLSHGFKFLFGAWQSALDKEVVVEVVFSLSCCSEDGVASLALVYFEAPYVAKRGDFVYRRLEFS